MSVSANPYIEFVMVLPLLKQNQSFAWICNITVLIVICSLIEKKYIKD